MKILCFASSILLSKPFSRETLFHPSFVSVFYFNSGWIHASSIAPVSIKIDPNIEKHVTQAAQMLCLVFCFDQ